MGWRITSLTIPSINEGYVCCCVLDVILSSSTSPYNLISYKFWNFIIWWLDFMESNVILDWVLHGCCLNWVYASPLVFITFEWIMTWSFFSFTWVLWGNLLVVGAWIELRGVARPTSFLILILYHPLAKF
jgi:hypothetical protein